MRWLVVIPAWGERCIDLLERVTLPAVSIAAAQSDSSFRLMVHTDDKPRVTDIAASWSSEIRDYHPRHSRYYSMTAAHMDAIRSARPGEAVAFINADMVPSREVFTAAEKRFADGKRMIMMAALRTQPDQPPPSGLKSRALLEWVWAHRHRWVEDCVWGRGRSVVPSMLHFEFAQNVVTRAFHLHPFAFVSPAHGKRPITFNGLTVDDGLAEVFHRDQIHVVTDPDEASFAEMSPGSFNFKQHKQALTANEVIKWACGPSERPNVARTSPTHRWLFGHRVIIRGDGVGVNEETVCNAILRELNEGAV